MKIIMLRGLPGAGKTRWAKKQNAIRVNKDDLRAMLHNSIWSKSNEKFVLSCRDEIIRLALRSGTDVVVDDTNLAPKHQDTLMAIAREENADFEIKDFTTVPIETCIERDLKRPNSVGSKVIMRMYNQYLKPMVEKVPYDITLPNAVICDLDGTLALIKDRSPYDFGKCEQDEPNLLLVGLLTNFLKFNHKIILCSGREDKYSPQTEAWLKYHQIPYHSLLMRPTGDFRKDSIVKQKLYKQNIKGKYNVVVVFDDRDQVVRMWRDNGLTCFQVNDGDF